MPEGLLAHGQRPQLADDNLIQEWVRGIGLAAAVGLAYFLVAKFSVRLILQPAGVAVFWPAAGISSGILIALGPHARWPVLAGVIVATVATHLIINDPLWAGVALGLCNGAEAVITAGLIRQYFGPGFNLVRVRHVVGLLAAAVAATTVSGIGGTVTYRLMLGPSAPMLSTWQHWFASDFVGVIAVAPLVIGLTAFATIAAKRSRRRYVGACGPCVDDWSYHFAAARTLGDSVPDRLAVSSFDVACRPRPTGVLRSGRVRGFDYDSLDDNLGHRSFWQP